MKEEYIREEEMEGSGYIHTTPDEDELECDKCDRIYKLHNCYYCDICSEKCCPSCSINREYRICCSCFLKMFVGHERHKNLLIALEKLYYTTSLTEIRASIKMLLILNGVNI